MFELQCHRKTGATHPSNITIRSLSDEYDAVIIACGAGAAEIPELASIPVHTVRGQVSHFTASHVTSELRMNLCFGGYLSPHQIGRHTLGATFQRWREDCDVTDEDHEENIKKLHEILPGLDRPQVTGGRAALRVSSKDRFPVIGNVVDNIYISVAHGSHGIVSTVAGAHLLADMITGAPRSLPLGTINALSPGRFAAREERKKNKS